MKKYLLIIFLFLFAGTAQAQDNTETETLFGRGVKISGFGGPTLSWALIDSNIGIMTGGGGGVILNQKFFIGGFGNGLSSSIRPFKDDRQLSFNYGGFWTGYQFTPKKLVHFLISAKIGWGSAGFKNNDPINGITNYRDNIFVMEPELAAEVNVTKFFKISLGGSYRQVSDIELVGFSGNKLSGPAVNASFKFGWFD